MLDLSEHFIENRIDLSRLAGLLRHLMIKDAVTGKERGEVLRQAKLVRLTTRDDYIAHYSKVLPGRAILPFEQRTKETRLGKEGERELMRINLLTATLNPRLQAGEILHKINLAINKGEYFGGLSTVRVMLVIQQINTRGKLLKNTQDARTINPKQHGVMPSYFVPDYQTKALSVFKMDNNAHLPERA